MKFGTFALALATLALAGCGSKNKGVKAFEEYFGEYAVETYQDSSNNFADTCPFTDATLRSGNYDGRNAVAIEAKHVGLDRNGYECDSSAVYTLTVEGLEGVSCDTSPGYSRCVRGNQTFEARASRSGDKVRIETRSSGETEGQALWVLRKK